MTTETAFILKNIEYLSDLVSCMKKIWGEKWIWVTLLEVWTKPETIIQFLSKITFTYNKIRSSYSKGEYKLQF